MTTEVKERSDNRSEGAESTTEMNKQTNRVDNKSEQMETESTTEVKKRSHSSPETECEQSAEKSDK